jgi:light-regulated signal transduction histidine kinase (bacteriophytochrome)
MHPLLRRQIKRHAPFDPDAVPEEWRAFMQAVSEAYDSYDSDHAMIERSLELSSAELLAKNRKIETQKAELIRSNSELENFAYIASHDLREPLRTVQSYMQLLRRRYQSSLDATALEFIDYAVSGATRMRTLIDDLLTYARVASRRRPLVRIPLSEIVTEVLRSLEVRLTEKDAEIEVGELPEVVADPRQLEQLFQNLVANAVKFHKAGQRPKVIIKAERKDDEWMIRVSDDGIGIDPAYKEKIFVLFQRLHSRDEYEGTGLGLAVSAKIVERHGGKMWVESELGQGATFLFTLPVEPVQDVHDGGPS